MKELAEIYCTVVTGFERISAEEINSKIAKSENCSPGRGRVRFSLPLEDVADVLKLRSIDNAFLVFYENRIENLKGIEKDEAMTRIQEQISFMNWKKAIEGWQNAHGREIFGGGEFVVEQMRNYMKTRTKAPVTENSPKFRVTCKRAGDKSAHRFTSMDAADKFGSRINDVFGWRISMKKFDIEVVLKIEGEFVMVMLALNNESLFKRNICAYGPTTMRSTICYGMIALADPKPGEIVIDAMCGGGSIGALSSNGVHYIGGEYHSVAIERCIENAANNSISKNTLDFCSWDATNLPIRSDSIDVIVTDLPYGRKIGNVSDNRIFYPLLFREWNRVLRKGGRLVVISHDKRTMDKAVNRENWHIESKHIVNIGGLDCLCLKLTNIKYSAE